ncbi:uncharacterized protein LOC128552158 [Mercenaria mercenaria]|uniref:uncharacterized protein LOC128552158 n=1 Tax=Mercenaria mercenaria TaxID=6596 RepID=UPI00234E60E6|nr:uncharacterized protein LOC128552158 [Mercenaria mercenaria]
MFSKKKLVKFFGGGGGEETKAKQTYETNPDKSSNKEKKAKPSPENSKNSFNTKVNEKNENLDENMTLEGKHQNNQHTDNVDEPKGEENKKTTDKATFGHDYDKMRSMISLTSDHKAVIFDTGKQCKDCMLKMYEARLKEDELRCMDCFSFECLHCKTKCECMGECFCNKFQDMFENQVRRASNELTNNLKQHVLIETSSNVSSAMTYEIHDSRKTIVISSVTISKVNKSDESTSIQKEKQKFAQQDVLNENNLEISILEYRDAEHVFLRRSQTVRVLLGMLQETIAAGIYSKEGLEKEITFIETLKKKFHSEDIQLFNIKQFAQVLEEDEMPIIVTCPLQSRLYADMNNSMSGIKEVYYKRIILVLIHYKIEDTDASAFCIEYENQFPALKCIDFFHQKRQGNIESVATEIKDALYQMRKKSYKPMND